MEKASQGRVGSLGPASLNKSGGFGLQVCIVLGPG